MSFINFLTESKDQLDISILAASKYLTTDAKKEWFLETPCTIEAKTDGVKLTIVKIDNTGNYTKDYIFAYKGNILYNDEFDYTSTYRVKKDSVGAAQFKLVFDHFKKLDTNSIPVGTELFVEYLMKKSTLSSNYKYPHKMVLIGHSKSKYTVKFGKLKTTPNGFGTDKRDIYAKMLKINTPLKLFNGILGTDRQFSKGIINKQLKSIYEGAKNVINWNNSSNIISNISSILLDVESAFGGTEEGVVIKFPDKILKIQQVYQVDPAARAKIKMKYRGLPEEEDLYWKNVKIAANELKQMIVIKSRPLDKILKDLAFNLKGYKVNFDHPKKNLLNIKEDIQLTAKTLIIKSMKGNNNALFFGKYRILTKAHYNIIKRAYTLYDDVVVALITSKNTKETQKLRLKMLKTAFPDLDIIQANTGNLVTLLNKSDKNINVVIAGSDRVQSYREQLKRTDIVVKEIPRINNDISATKIINNISDFEYFKANTPKQIHGMYKEILNTYKGKING